MDRPSTAVIIPCHNEAKTLGAVVSRACAFADVFVIDDRSTDASRQVAEAEDATVVASAHPGYDGALDTGLKLALDRNYTFIITLDADGEHDPALVEDFIKALNDGADLVCGRRVRKNRLAEHLAGLIGRLDLGVNDPLCGMKGYSRRLLELYRQSDLPLHVNMTPMMLGVRKGWPIAQVQVTGEVRVDPPRFARALRANMMILKALLLARSDAARWLHEHKAR